MLVRRMAEEDTAKVARIEKECFSQPWSQQGFIDALKGSDNILVVAEKNGEIYGYVCMYVSFEEGEITNVAVSEQYRNKGVGRLLMQAIEREAEANGVERIVLEVRVSNNSAISLYKSMNYRELGIRKNFYEQPVEDACIMECIIQEGK